MDDSIYSGYDEIFNPKIAAEKLIKRELGRNCYVDSYYVGCGFTVYKTLPILKYSPEDFLYILESAYPPISKTIPKPYTTLCKGPQA